LRRNALVAHSIASLGYKMGISHCSAAAEVQGIIRAQMLCMS